MPPDPDLAPGACDDLVGALPAAAGDAVAAARTAVAAAGGTFEGDAAAGRAALDLPGVGRLVATYRTEAGRYRVRILEKPWLVPCELVRQAVASHLESASPATGEPAHEAALESVARVLRATEYGREFILPRAPALQRGLGGSSLLDILNGLARLGRDRRYRARLRDDPRAPRIVSEGDSWFNYPFLGGDDLVDYLVRDDRFAVRSLGGAGDSLSGMSRGERSEAVRAVRELEGRASAVLLSGGGIDLLFSGFERLFVDAADELFEDPADYLAAAGDAPLFERRLARVETDFRRLIAALRVAQPGIPVAVQGYDHPIPREGRHIGRTFAARRIPRAAWRPLARHLLDRFNEVLAELQRDHADVTHIDLRGSLPHEDDWYDEIHASRDALRTDLGPRFVARIVELL